MKGKPHSTEEIIRILRQADGGETAQSVCREHNISEQTFYRWKKKYGDMELADAKRLKALEKENAELKKMLAESMLENRVFKEVNANKWWALRTKKRRYRISLESAYVRCEGPVAMWGCRAQLMTTYPSRHLPPRATSSAYRRLVPGASTLWLPSHPRAAGQRRLDGKS